MKKQPLPQIDSIEALAHFWDTHDLTDFEEELEEVVEPVFVRDTAVTIHLLPEEAKAIQKIVSSQVMPDADLISRWVQEKLQRA